MTWTREVLAPLTGPATHPKGSWREALANLPVLPRLVPSGREGDDQPA